MTDYGIKARRLGTCPLDPVWYVLLIYRPAYHVRRVRDSVYGQAAAAGSKTTETHGRGSGPSTSRAADIRDCAGKR